MLFHKIFMKDNITLYVEHVTTLQFSIFCCKVLMELKGILTVTISAKGPP